MKNLLPILLFKGVLFSAFPVEGIKTIAIHVDMPEATKLAYVTLKGPRLLSRAPASENYHDLYEERYAAIQSSRGLDLDKGGLYVKDKIGTWRFNLNHVRDACAKGQKHYSIEGAEHDFCLTENHSLILSFDLSDSCCGIKRKTVETKLQLPQGYEAENLDVWYIKIKEKISFTDPGVDNRGAT